MNLKLFSIIEKHLKDASQLYRRKFEEEEHVGDVFLEKKMIKANFFFKLIYVSSHSKCL